MKKISNNYKGTTAIGKCTEVIKRPELGALSGVKWIYGMRFKADCQEGKAARVFNADCQENNESY